MDPLNNVIILEELNEVIKATPTDKASGVNKIVYKDYKLSGIKFRTYLLILYNEILRIGKILKEWKQAVIYPILKPKEWECQLNNTQPITLLYTGRKLFVKILTNRLNKILTVNHILQWNNRAELIGESCFQPIQFIQHVIEQCQLHQQPLWIGLQDLSKVYDRVNISLL
jgi:hypothetical protein